VILFIFLRIDMLPNDVILIRNIEEGHEGLRGRGGGNDDQQGHPTGTGGPVQWCSQDL